MIVCYAGRLSRSTCKEGQRHGKLSSILSLPWSAKADRIGRSEVPRLLKDLLSQQRSGASQVRLHDFLEQDDLLFLLHAQEQNVPYSMTTRMNMMRAFLAPSSSNSHPTQEPLQYLAGQGNIIQQSKANVFFFFLARASTREVINRRLIQEYHLRRLLLLVYTSLSRSSYCLFRLQFSCRSFIQVVTV